jgi:hypothetical protein
MGDIAFSISLLSLTITSGDEPSSCDFGTTSNKYRSTSFSQKELLVLTSICVIDSFRLEVTYSKKDYSNFRFFLPSTKIGCLFGETPMVMNPSFQ